MAIISALNSHLHNGMAPFLTILMTAGDVNCGQPKGGTTEALVPFDETLMELLHVQNLAALQQCYLE